MVHRVKAGKLCGTIAGFYWPREAKRGVGGYRGRGRRPEESAGTEDGLTSGHRRFLCLGSAGMVEGELLLEEAGQAGLT